MITELIRRHEVLLPIDHNRYNIISEKINAFFFSKRAFKYQMYKIKEHITGGDTGAVYKLSIC